MNCHRVRGTPAQGSYGPDLTHLMSRKTLASGLVPNDSGEFAPLDSGSAAGQAGLLDAGIWAGTEKRERIVDYLLSLQ